MTACFTQLSEVPTTVVVVFLDSQALLASYASKHVICPAG